MLKHIIWFLRKIEPNFIKNIPKKFLTAETFDHPWFTDNICYRITFVDILGRKWHRAWGIKKESVPVYRLSKRNIWIDKLGGMSWKKSGSFFVCQHRIG